MPRFVIPTGFKATGALTQGAAPALALENPAGHVLSVHPVTEGIVRVTHELPKDKYPQKRNGESAVAWEEPLAGVTVSETQEHGASYSVETSNVRIDVILEPNASPRLAWYAKVGDTYELTPFFRDSQTRAYTFDAATGAVMHYVERELFLPVSEDEDTVTAYGQPFLHDKKNEFVYGFGESRGSLEKSGKKFTMGGRDALAYDWEEGDPIYKYCPYYCVYNKKTQKWFGLYYNTVADAKFDTGSEHDVLWGCFRSYHANAGPLDYYVLLGDGTLPSIVKAYASLVSPTPAKETGLDFAPSPTLPPLSQFGYLSCSLSLGSLPNAQEAVIEFLHRCRKEGFPIDGLFLSSGWCQNDKSGDRNYFAWNLSRYPKPYDFGTTIEGELHIQTMMNVKPWFLDAHPFMPAAAKANSFVRAAPDATLKSPEGAAKTWLWSSGFACHKLGSYFDFSSQGGSEFWKTCIKEQLIANGCTGVWNDNNEMAGMLDDAERFAGEVPMWQAKGEAGNVEKRLGWNGGEITCGAVGKAIQTMGMARASYEAIMESRPNNRPVVVSRSGVPGVQAYAHSSWSGDNSTTWKALKWGTKMTLSVGMSFGAGLYGHDVGGFAGSHHPSAELLVRWVQNGAWHTRLTENSWKEIATTLWMYNDVPGVSQILRDSLGFRYLLAPSFYSLYITDYYRNAAPVIKPLLWFHSVDPVTLTLDEEMVFGSHVLVAPVTEKGARTRQIYLPAIANDGSTDIEWCELDTGVWHQGGGVVELDAPLSRTPALVRSGGILVLGGVCTRNIFDGITERTAHIFPSPTKASEGTFTLIEDDGKSNDHTSKKVYTEIELAFKSADATTVEVSYAVVHGKYKLPYDTIFWALPEGDQRKVVGGHACDVAEVTRDGRRRFAMKVKH
ncbi:hypothetical protein MNV49_005493 [Pseudohyphozyma bogoriensis]|nr:hypothetical protein MNV49_005493 [Pseudohyphozyma bogoriensis]